MISQGNKQNDDKELREYTLDKMVMESLFEGVDIKQDLKDKNKLLNIRAERTFQQRN